MILIILILRIKISTFYNLQPVIDLANSFFKCNVNMLYQYRPKHFQTNLKDINMLININQL